VARQLAEEYGALLILVGRSPLPEGEEDADTAALTDPGELKAALIKRHQTNGDKPKAAQIESKFQRIMRDREIRANLDAIRAAGSEVHYFQVDVRDRSALTDLLKRINKEFGGIDGVIHAAGVIEDKLVRDKEPESFDRVFHTKVDSAAVLAEQLDPGRLKFCVFFSSLASRYGNRGQSDYAAANEILSKLAADLDRRWPARVLAIAWGPWSGVGMVADLEKHLTARGLKLISPDEGPRFVVEELAFGRKGEAEVIIAGGAEKLAQPTQAARQTVG
jgi:NAD(P)-dependent dehydrogenase (short-subunit alcohol dehydrogenase family)